MAPAQRGPGPGGPILAIAGGSGLAPFGQSCTGNPCRRSSRRIVLYLGAHAEAGLYGLDEFASLARQCPGLQVVPVVTMAGDMRFRHGTVAAAIRSDFNTLDGWTAYMAGPPPMIAEIDAALQDIGLAAADRHADPFYSVAEMQML
ncbi:MAG: hypothetical protein U1E97_07195 [Alphaproteobacteria bacterium]